MKAILVIDLDQHENIDIEDTKATYIELETKNGIRKISLIGHWLKPMPDKIDEYYPCRVYDEGYYNGYNACIDEILGDNDE